jgi:hypothetical protein
VLEAEAEIIYAIGIARSVMARGEVGLCNPLEGEEVKVDSLYFKLCSLFIHHPRASSRPDVESNSTRTVIYLSPGSDHGV